MMERSVLLALIVVATVGATAQVRVMPRVDVRSAEVRTVMQAWVDSLESWRAAPLRDAQAGRGADVLPGGCSGIVKNWFAQDEEVRLTFPPTVLSIEPTSGAWVVRTMFSHINSSTGDIYPLGILRAMVTMEEGQLHVHDALASTTQGWERTTVGPITFVYQHGHHLRRDKAESSISFMNVIAQEFGVGMPDSITYYIMRDRDALCAAVGVEFYAAPPSAICYPSAGVVISGTDDEWNPHELVHIVLSRYEQAVPIIREGVATLLGGSLGMSFDSLLTAYRATHPAEKVPTFRQLFTQATQEEQYVLGAALCKAVYDKKGTDGLVTLLTATTPLRAMDHIARILGVTMQQRDESLAPILDEVNATLREPGRSGPR